jgi:peptide deformylase
MIVRNLGDKSAGCHAGDGFLTLRVHTVVSGRLAWIAGRRRRLARLTTKVAMTVLPANGTVRPIVRWGDPVLHRASRPVAEFGDQLAALVADLVATMRAAYGVGLAANQIGVDLALFVFDCADADEVRQHGVICNPLLTLPAGRQRHLDDAEEGCLSLPGAFISCARPDEASVVGADHRGRPVRVHGTGLLARCLQHESDHVLGTVFADLLARRSRRTLLARAEACARDFPPSWPVGSE